MENNIIEGRLEGRYWSLNEYYNYKIEHQCVFFNIIVINK